MTQQKSIWVFSNWFASKLFYRSKSVSFSRVFPGWGREGNVLRHIRLSVTWIPLPKVPKLISSSILPKLIWSRKYSFTEITYSPFNKTKKICKRESNIHKCSTFMYFFFIPPTGNCLIYNILVEWSSPPLRSGRFRHDYERRVCGEGYTSQWQYLSALKKLGVPVFHLLSKKQTFSENVWYFIHTIWTKLQIECQKEVDLVLRNFFAMIL